MGRAVSFDHPTDEQQSQHNAEDELLLSGQIIHCIKVMQIHKTASLCGHGLLACRPGSAPVILPAIMTAIGRFRLGEEVFFAKVIDGEVYPLHGDPFTSAPVFAKKAVSRKGMKTLVPVVPGKVIAVGLNYEDHIAEMRRERPTEPLFWFKANTSLLPDGGKIEIPFPDHRTDFEAELAIVIGRRVRNVTPAMAARYILGYTAAQDLSDRTIQKAESQWARCKSFDTFTPLGPFIETQLDPAELSIQLFQNGAPPEFQYPAFAVPARRTGELHFAASHVAAGRCDSHRYARGGWSDKERGQAGGPHRRPRSAHQYREINDSSGRSFAATISVP